MARYNCLLIDLDNTLLDFSAAQHTALEGMLTELGLPYGEEIQSAYAAINDQVWDQFEKGQLSKAKLQTKRFSLLLAQLGIEGDAVKMNDVYMEKLSACGDMVPGADEFLAEMAEVATVAVVSNGVQQIQMSRIAASGLGSFFDEVFVSEKLGCQKPQRKFFDIALKNLGVTNREKVLVIGDSLTSDIQGGAAAGLATCWFNPRGLSNTTEQKPTYTVYGFEELKPVIYGEDGMPDVERRERHRDGH